MFREVVYVNAVATESCRTAVAQPPGRRGTMAWRNGSPEPQEDKAVWGARSKMGAHSRAGRRRGGGEGELGSWRAPTGAPTCPAMRGGFAESFCPCPGGTGGYTALLVGVIVAVAGCLGVRRYAMYSCWVREAAQGSRCVEGVHGRVYESCGKGPLNSSEWPPAGDDHQSEGGWARRVSSDSSVGPRGRLPCWHTHREHGKTALNGAHVDRRFWRWIGCGERTDPYRAR